MQTTQLKLHCALLFGLLLGTRKAAGLLQASLAVIDGVDALELQLPQQQEQEQEQEQLQMQMSRAEVLLDAVPAAARGSFLLYQLAKAINSEHLPGLELAWEQEEIQEQIEEQQQELLVEQQVLVDSSWLAAMANEFQNIPVYTEFPMDLQTWLMDSYGLNAIDVYQNWPTARSANVDQEICNAVGQCFEVAQIMSACCPF